MNDPSSHMPDKNISDENISGTASIKAQKSKPSAQKQGHDGGGAGQASERSSQRASDKPSCKPSDKPSGRPSERLFRRSRRAQMRRRQAAKDDAAFFQAVFSLAGVAAALVFVLVYGVWQGGFAIGGSLSQLSRPWIGSFSRLEALGVGAVIVLGYIYYLRIKRRK